MATAEAKPVPSGPERVIGHILSLLLGFASMIGGVAGLASSLPGVLGATLLVSGALLVVLTIYSLKYSRAAWSFLIAMHAVLATVTFFGAPKIHRVLDIGLGPALVIPALMIAAVVSLSMARGEYK